MAIESACIPLPSEVIRPFACYLVSTGRFELVLAATAGALGCNVGSIVAYEAGKRGGRPLIERWGRFVLIGPGELDAADRFFARWGSIAVLIGRSEEHTSELQSLMRLSYAVFCLKKKT